MRTAKRALAVVCLLAFSLVAFAVPAAAIDDPVLVPQLGGPSRPSWSVATSSGLRLGKKDQYDTGIVGCYETNIYAFAVQDGSAFDFYVATAEGGNYYFGYSSGTWITGSSYTTDSTTGLQYRLIFDNYISSNIGAYNSLQAGLTATKLVIDYGSGGGADTQTYRFTVPAGYVAYISLEDPDQEIDISATMFNNSALIGTNGSYWPTNATIRDGASYPSAGTQFPISGADTIRWYKDAGGATNLLGQTKSARAVFHASSNLVEIYNPYHTGSTVGDSTEAATSWLAGDPNPNLVVTVTGLSPNGVRMYSLSDRLDVSSDAPSFIVSGSNDDFGNYVESSNQPPETPDPTNPQPVISWKTQDGDPTPAPSPGGENEPIQSASIADILSNFLSRFTSLFTEGFDAIRNLSENASQFVSRLTSLYAWLPPQILGVLTSAIILAIIVGVLKVFF